MRILADVALPNAGEVFSQYGEVTLKTGREIAAEDLTEVDALIIRSVTKINENLLARARRLKFVGTATAGTDHVDRGLLEERGVAFDSAPGSNRESVGDYILSVLLTLAQKLGFELKGRSIGVIGCGNTGSRVCLKAEGLGMTIVKNDPPRLRGGDHTCGGTLDEALACDIVTCHVPLNRDGPDCTRHLLDYKRLINLKPGAVLINASRGEVVDNQALARALRERPDLKAWCDVFEGEPEIAVRELLPLLEGATPHIAGYSYESKRRASVMLAKSMARALALPEPEPYLMPESELAELTLGRLKTLDLNLLSRLVFAVYDVRYDAARFKNEFSGGRSFDRMRVGYRERRELSSLKLLNVPAEHRRTFSLLGFTVA